LHPIPSNPILAERLALKPEKTNKYGKWMNRKQIKNLIREKTIMTRIIK
jgi:hypothetical protein